MKTVLAAAALAMSAAVAMPAQAIGFTFDLTHGGTSASPVAYGNARSYAATAGQQALGLRATAWTLNDGKVSSAYLASYATGLGVLNQREWNLFGNHTADNLNGSDFILLQFSQAVSLTSAVLNPYSVWFDTPDNDSTLRWGALDGAWNQALALGGISEASLGTLFAGTINIASNGAPSQTFSIKGAGNLWMIGASQANPDCNTDGFKLAALGVATAAAVPEPATWAMMLIGFGMVAGAARYRRRHTAVRFARA